MRTVCPLSVLTSGQTSTVTLLAGGREVSCRLAAMGISPGAPVTMMRNSQRGPLIVMIRNTRIALGRGEARAILVEAAAAPAPAAASAGGEMEQPT